MLRPAEFGGAPGRGLRGTSMWCLRGRTSAWTKHNLQKFGRRGDLMTSKWAVRKKLNLLGVMYGCSGQHRSRAFSWLSLFASLTQRGEPIPPISVGRVAMNQSHTRVVRVEFIGTHLSFREAKPRKQEYRWLNTQGSEAVLKVQLQRRVGKNHV